MVDEKKPPQPDRQSVDQSDIWLTRSTRDARDTGRGPVAYSPDSQPASHKRSSIRREIGCHVLINTGMGYVVVRHTRNLSLGGVLVEMDIDGIQPGDLVECVLEFTYEGRTVEQRIPAQVARVHQDRVAFKFGRYDNRTYTDLVNFLYTA